MASILERQTRGSDADRNPEEEIGKDACQPAQPERIGGTSSGTDPAIPAREMAVTTTGCVTDRSKMEDDFLSDSAGHQIDRYRKECRMTVEELAEEIEVSTRTVHRHIAGTCVPLPRNLSGYERVFSMSLNKHIVIKNMS